MFHLLANPVIVGMVVLLLLALRMHVVVALISGAIAAGIAGAMPLQKIFSSFQDGLSSGAAIAVNYSLLGAFACALASSGMAELVRRNMVKNLKEDMCPKTANRLRWRVLLILTAIAFLCKSLIPVHVAFIPLLVPPLLEPMAQLRMDRRAVACAIVFGLVISYVILPIGFGSVFLKNILMENLAASGLKISMGSAISSCAIPAACAAIGLAIATCFTYGKPRSYNIEEIRSMALLHSAAPSRWKLISALLAIAVVLAVQLLTNNCITAAMVVGLLFLWASGSIGSEKINAVVEEGICMMATISMVMVVASGFSSVLRASGGVDSLVAAMASLCGDNRPIASALMLCTGTLIAFTIGSSFATIPVVSAIYVPLCASIGFSPAATVAIVAFSAVPGDPASPLSNSTLGASSGLAVDGQFDHMRDCVLPSIFHCSLPLLVGGWIAAMVL